MIYMSESDYYIRTYIEGDETSLLPLFDQYFGHYAGFVPRTLQEWLWFCKLNPFIGPEGILMVCKGKEIVGYAAIGMMSQGNGFQIYELCYNPSYDGELIVSNLLRRIEQFVNEKGGSYVNFYPPSDDALVKKVCDELGFIQYPHEEVVIAIILDIVKLVEHIIEGKGRDWRLGDETFFIRLKDVPLPHNIISIRWSDGKFSFSNRAVTDEPGVLVDTDFPTLSRLILGGESIPNAVLKSKLAIRPFWKIRKGIGLISLLCLRDPWYIPRRGISQ